MHVGQRRRLHVLIVSFWLIGVLASPVGAEPRHDANFRVTEDTADTLPKQSVRVGLFKWQYGVFDSLMVGTYTVPWVVALANFQLKYRYFDDPHWSAAIEMGVGRLDVTRLRPFETHPGDAIIVVSSVEPSLSYRPHDRVVLSATIPMSKISVDGTVNTKAFEGVLEGAVDNLQLTATMGWKVSSELSLWIHGRYLALQHIYGDTEATYHPDPYTRIVIHADARTTWLSLGDTWSVLPQAALSFGSFHVRAGIGYGNWNISPVNFVLPQKGLIPQLDAFFLW